MTGEEYNHINDVMQDLYQDGKLSEEDFDCICNIIDRADRYDKCRWHDLREDPNDLPEVGKPFVYAFRTKDLPNRILYNSAMGFEAEVECVKHQGNGYAEYIAWMYFEPFEEK